VLDRGPAGDRRPAGIGHGGARGAPHDLHAARRPDRADGPPDPRGRGGPGGGARMTELVVARGPADPGELAPTGALIAGGTDILVRMRAGREVPRLIDVSNLADPPPVVAASDGVVELSALAPISEVIVALQGRLPALEQSAVLFGSIQVRNRATIGGNLQNASPAADMVPPLVAADAGGPIRRRA